MSDDNVTNLPKPGVVLDLDNAKRPEKDVRPPFIVTVGNKDITFADPGEIDWRELASIHHPADLVRVALEKDDLKHIQAQENFPSWKFNLLLESYSEHYDLEDKIREARQRAQFAGL